MVKQTQTYQHSVSKIPVNIKLVEEGKIDVENITEGLEHELFYQRAVKQTPQKIAYKRLQRRKQA